MTNTILGILPQIYFAPEGAQQPAPSPQAPQSITVADPDKEEDNFEDEEIVLPDGDGDEGDDTPAPKPEADNTPAPPPPKKRGPKRYAALTRERDEARSFAEQVARENEQLRRETAAANAKAAESDTVAMQTFESKAKSDLVAAKRAHTEALSSNDAEKITEASEALASARSVMDDVEAFKRQKPAAAAPAQPQQAPQQQPAQQDLPTDIKNWVMDNPWFDAVARDRNGNPIVDAKSGQYQGNPDFDADMHSEAVLFSSALERKIARGQKNFKVSSPEYFAEVEKHMREEFPDYFTDDDDAETPAAAPQRRGSPVAGPGNRNLPGAKPAKGGQSYKLSADEIRFITRSHQNGGGPKYPKGHPEQFKPMSLQDAKVSFARRKMAQAKESGT